MKITHETAKEMSVHALAEVVRHGLCVVEFSVEAMLEASTALYELEVRACENEVRRDVIERMRERANG